MSEELRLVQSGRARALVAPGFAAALDELAALDRDAWQAQFDRSDRATSEGRGAICDATLADGSQLVLRGFRRGGWLGPLRGAALSSPDRLFAELRACHQLAQRGAPVPTPAFAVAHRGAACWTGGVATRRIPAAGNGLELLRSQPAEEHLARISQAAGRAVRAFHEAGGQHADLHIGNLLVRDIAEPQVFVIDLDRARVGPPPGPARRARELARLERSLHKWLRRGADAAGAPRRVNAICSDFLRGYVGSEVELREALRAPLRRERRRAALHRLRYRWPARPTR